MAERKKSADISRPAKPVFTPKFREIEKELKSVLSRGLTGADLARNPFLSPVVARALSGEVFTRNLAETTLSDIGGLIRNITGSKHIPNLGSLDAESKRFKGTSLLSEFTTETARLKQAFVDEEVERQFGPQNVTSRTSIVNAQGVRVPVPGQSAITRPTQKQIDAIAASFRTPLQKLQPGQPTSLTPPARPRDPTIISGAGVRRRRIVAAPTILTSDSDARGGSVLGGSTILG